MFVNKIGLQHLEIGMNCQDYGVQCNNIKLVCDGCSEGSHTEVGAKTYCHLAERGYGLHQIFKRLVDIFGESSKSVKNYLCFTIISLSEDEDMYKLNYCGDGYIILQDLEGDITFEELTDGEYPKYFAYNYVDSDTLKYYKDGVEMNEKEYSKDIYQNIGVASDGLRFILREDDELQDEFISILKLKNAVKMKRFINKYQSIFKDDITIVF